MKFSKIELFFKCCYDKFKNKKRLCIVDSKMIVFENKIN